MLLWPAISPDLSPIERLWDQLDRRGRKGRQQPDVGSATGSLNGK